MILNLYACSVLVILLMVMMVASAHAMEERIVLPQWVKNTAQWWSKDKITDRKFLTAIAGLVKRESISIKPAINDHIPPWTKNIASMWSYNMISDNEFLSAFRYLIENNIINLTPQTLNIISARGLTEIPYSGYSPLFRTTAYAKDITIINGRPTALEVHFALRPELSATYEKIAIWDKPHSAAVIVPLFTSTAYWEPGFYTFYRGDCDSSCLTKNIEFERTLVYSSSGNAVHLFSLLGYDRITDLDVDENPQILKSYDKIIVLHNEYVTKKEFDAITSHPKVIYLYPNPLYAEVSVDYEKDAITLVKGHGYPTPDIRNAFNWKFDNSKYEYDANCADDSFYKVDNGIMWNCFPENTIYTNMTLLKIIKDY